ncbi:MmyB family transcriptional regulator [Sphaerisporangium sp. NPDC004334]
MSAAFVRNGRQDIVTYNALAHALLAPVFDSLAAQHGRANIARYVLLDPGSQQLGRGRRRQRRSAARRRPDASPTTGPCATSSVSCPLSTEF